LGILTLTGGKSKAGMKNTENLLTGKEAHETAGKEGQVVGKR